MSNDVNRHEIELDMVLLNNGTVFTAAAAAAAILIVDVLFVIFDAVEMKRRIKKQNIEPTTKTKQIFITTIHNPTTK